MPGSLRLWTPAPVQRFLEQELEIVSNNPYACASAAMVVGRWRCWLSECLLGRQIGVVRIMVRRV